MKISLFAHPFAPCLPEIFEASSVGQWLLDHYGDVPTVNVQIFKGDPCAANEITGDIPALMATGDDEYSVLESPGEAMTIAYVVMAVFMVASALLTPQPVMPGNVNRTQQSPNNALGNRSNQVRIRERVEDILGSVKSIPSLMMPTYVKYRNNLKYEYGLYCVSRGYCDIEQLKDGDTLLSDIPHASAAVYWPFSSPNGGYRVSQIGEGIIDKISTVARAIEVDGILLPSPNDRQLPNVASSYWLSGFTGEPYLIRQSNDADVAFGSLVRVDDVIHLTRPAQPGYWSEHRVLAVNGRTIQVTDGSAAWPRYGAGYGLILQLIKDPIAITPWVTLPQKDRTEVWCNIVARQGLYKESSGKNVVRVDFKIEIERLNPGPTGDVEVVTGSLSGATSDECAVTIEHVTSWKGPVRVRVYRTSSHDYAFSGQVQDEIAWADLYAVTPETKPHFGNKTLIHTVTEANSRATSVKSRQLNCIAYRLLPTFNGAEFSGAFNNEGRHVSGSIHRTSKLVDLIAAVSVDPEIGARNINDDIDMKQIYAIQQQLDAWNPVCGQFNYTLDSDKISYEDTVVMIANAGFCIAYRQNGKIRLALDGPKVASSALFTHRNKKPNSEKIIRSFANDGEYDAVEFVYMDEDSNTQETITLPLDGNYTSAKKFEIAGIRSFAQAWLRANREYQKMQFQRVTIETSTTMDARLLLPNARIDIVDNTRFKSYDGEVTGQLGMELRLSRDVEFTAGQPHSLVLMRRDGSLQSIPVTPGRAPNCVILSQLPSEPVVSQFSEEGIRTIYSFAADSARNAMAYLVQEIDLSDGQYATIKAVNYSDKYWLMDKAPIPDKSKIIN